MEEIKRIQNRLLEMAKEIHNVLTRNNMFALRKHHLLSTVKNMSKKYRTTKSSPL